MAMAVAVASVYIRFVFQAVEAPQHLTVSAARHEGFSLGFFFSLVSGLAFLCPAITQGMLMKNGFSLSFRTRA